MTKKKKTRGNQRGRLAYEVGVDARVIKKTVTPSASSGPTAQPVPRSPTHLGQTHTLFVKRRDSWRDRRLTEGKVEPKGYGGMERGRDTSTEVELGWGRAAAAKILLQPHTKKNIKVGHR